MGKTKKKQIAIIVGTIAILIVILGLYLGLPVEKRYNDMIFGNLTMDTYIKVNVTNQKKVGNKIYNAVKNVDDLMNPTSENSDIYKINHSIVDEAVEVNDMTIDLLALSYDLFQKTGGLFNPASYYLVDLWGFSAEKFNPGIEHTVPSQDKIDLGIQIADQFKNIKFIEEGDTAEQIQTKKQAGSIIVDKVNKTVTRTAKCFINDSSVMIDLGGIAKGYASELCYNIFRNSGAENGLVNIAGNVYTFNKDWLVGIENPFMKNVLANGNEETNIFGVATLNNLSVSCSGVYQRNYKIGNDLYHHIINTTTGKPQEITRDSIVMAGVIGKNGAICDAVATALVLYGSIDRAVEFISNNYQDEITGVILINGNKEYKIIGDVSLKVNTDELVGFNKI